ncbi:hypothetical protein GUJ93_ZPchr0005g14351 [Zizania palustris]|uniref:Uncharacterized protein n=1 Tax=Zizania palustris TaxID=103762 RepID=A0A8J5T6B4_ZIZPA|nr:hypothetical protein GUJ93_ZPchr0005g14351 [Zizania palustris]
MGLWRTCVLARAAAAAPLPTRQRSSPGSACAAWSVGGHIRPPASQQANDNKPADGRIHSTPVIELRMPPPLGWTLLRLGRRRRPTLAWTTTCVEAWSLEA